VSSRPVRVPGGIARIVAWSCRSEDSTAVIAALAVALGIVALSYGPGLARGGVLLPADMLDAFAPWSAASSIERPRNPLLGDEIQQMYPWRAFAHEELAQGRFPFWNPYSGGGVPLFANGQSALLYPLNLGTAWLSPEIGATVVQLAKPPIAAVGSALFLRALAARPAACVLAAVAWAFSGPMVTWLGWPHTNALALVPFLFWSATHWLRMPSIRWWAITAGLVAIQFFGGHPETTVHTLLLLATYVFVWRWQVAPPGNGTEPRRGALASHARALGGLAVSVVVGAGVAAVQVAPLVASIADSVTAFERGSRALSRVVLDPETAVTWVVPRFFGTPLSASFGPLNYLNYNETLGYVGVGVIALALLSALRPRRPGWPGLALVAVLALGLAYGVPGITEIRRLPLLAFAANTRFIHLAAFALACLGGLGLDQCLREPRRAEVAAGGLALVAFGCVLLTFAPWLLAPSSAAALPLSSAEAEGLRVRELWKAGTLALLWSAALAAVAIAVRRTGWQSRLAMLARGRGAMQWPWAGRTWLGRHAPEAATAMVTLVLAVDLMLFGSRYNPVTSVDFLRRVPSPIAFLQDTDAQGRVVGLAETLLPNTSVLFHLHDFRVYEPVADRHLLTYFEKMDASLRSDIRSRFYLFLWRPSAAMMRAAGIRWILVPDGDNRVATPRELANEGLILRFSGDGTRVWENPRASPRAYVADHVVAAHDEEAALDWLADLSDDSSSRAVVVASDLPITACDVKGSCDPANGQGTDAARVLEARYLPGRIDLRVDAPRGGVAVIDDVLYPGWSATVDGVEAPILRTNYLFMGVAVSPGQHLVELRYLPPHFRLGVAVSIASLFILIATIAVTIVRGRSTVRGSPLAGRSPVDDVR